MKYNEIFAWSCRCSSALLGEKGKFSRRWRRQSPWCRGSQKPHLVDIISWMPLPLNYYLGNGWRSHSLRIIRSECMCVEKLWNSEVAGFARRPFYATRTCRHGAFAGDGGFAFIHICIFIVVIEWGMSESQTKIAMLQIIQFVSNKLLKRDIWDRQAGSIRMVGRWVNYKYSEWAAKVRKRELWMEKSSRKVNSNEPRLISITFCFNSSRTFL